jgi:hypothetical protein
MTDNDRPQELTDGSRRFAPLVELNRLLDLLGGGAIAAARNSRSFKNLGTVVLWSWPATLECARQTAATDRLARLMSNHSRSRGLALRG